MDGLSSNTNLQVLKLSISWCASISRAFLNRGKLNFRSVNYSLSYTRCWLLKMPSHVKLCTKIVVLKSVSCLWSLHPFLKTMHSMYTASRNYAIAHVFVSRIELNVKDSWPRDWLTPNHNIMQGVTTLLSPWDVNAILSMSFILKSDDDEFFCFHS